MVCMIFIGTRPREELMNPVAFFIWNPDMPCWEVADYEKDKKRKTQGTPYQDNYLRKGMS